MRAYFSSATFASFGGVWFGVGATLSCPLKSPSPSIPFSLSTGCKNGIFYFNFFLKGTFRVNHLMNTDSFKSPSLCNFGYLPSIMNILYVYLSLPPYYSVVIVKKEIASFLPKSVCFTACFFRLFLSFFSVCDTPSLHHQTARVWMCVVSSMPTIRSHG